MFAKLKLKLWQYRKYLIKNLKNKFYVFINLFNCIINVLKIIFQSIYLHLYKVLTSATSIGESVVQVSGILTPDFLGTIVRSSFTEPAYSG